MGFDNIEKVLLTLLAIFMVPLIVFSLYLVFFIIPVSMYTDAECLRNGYPNSSVTIGLERYCTTLDGSVTVKVDHR